MFKEKFGKKLRFFRRQKDLTQEQLAEAIGVSVEFISNIERGINAPSFETLEKLCEALQLLPKELFDF
jgi:transcriptional regulator with XRE-family HTH domain